jgi:hypothetical protein
MRSYSWRVATAAIILMYPAAYFAKYAVDYVGLRLTTNGTLVDQMQMLHLGTVSFVAIAVLGWFIAFYSGLAAMQSDDPGEGRLGRFSFITVLAATAFYALSMAV